MKRVSIKDVAREAGVSAATVSYVLNNHPGETISAQTTKRVIEAVKQLQYVPNLNARSLSSRKTNLIGVVIPQTEPGKEFIFSNPFYGELLSSIEYTARKNGYHLLLSGTESNQSYTHIAQNRGVDGIIIVGSYPTTQLDELHQINTPVVLIDTYVNDPSFHTIGIDDRAGGKKATTHLIEKGHRRIAFISGSIQERGVNQRRYIGYVEALIEADLKLDEQLVFADTVTFEHGIAMAKMLEHCDVTAAFVTADVLSMGLVKGMHQLGKRIPENLSICSFDDVNLAQMCDPSLTTIRQDISAKGRHAVEMILAEASGVLQGKQELILPIELIQRSSVMTRGKEENACSNT